MISLAILIRAYLVIGLIFGGAAYADACAEHREGWKLREPSWTILIAVFLAAITWLPAGIVIAFKKIWKEIRHG